LLVAATGTAPFTYRWKLNTKTILDAESDSLIITHATAADSGDYLCIITNAWGADTGKAIRVRVLPTGSPVAPQNLRLVKRDSLYISLTWSAVDSIDGYRIYREIKADGSGQRLSSQTKTGYIDERKTGVDYYWVTTYKGNLESSPSNVVFTGDTATAVKNLAPQWARDTFSLALNEGANATLDLKGSSFDPDRSDTLRFSLDSASAGVIDGDTLLRYSAGNRSAGLYTAMIIASDGKLADTAMVKIIVNPVVCTLTITPAVNGAITSIPTAGALRWGDSVVVTAVANSGYTFSAWSGVGLTNESVIRIILTTNQTLSAQFVKVNAVVLQPGASLSARIKDVSPSAMRPVEIAPQAGLYDEGTIGIEGEVRVLVE
jgi:hypothetical protein